VCSVLGDVSDNDVSTTLCKQLGETRPKTRCCASDYNNLAIMVGVGGFLICRHLATIAV
jgi:hypothetical protein